ncbi:MarR family transcriptional regulator [Corynebacterium felinum]|uniref:DNA-binding MarR family transcriptional regulator n=1 Tax=Corynebacterium felinum TaxID=131318 RepID=A0ABU2B9Y0_9CORY|nr:MULTISPECIES: MarR family transcriptional regulator [Corynebacterium]MDF5820406.1 MarR family transcriptional regulator [Corynebacterium felinum]MDO4760450.1 MarR family transcriptional regulator [Corynebacterium sp.]MDR7355442.1 DNA-binding MarR family transcriptional regulator [Corynebacterium felinum]WJY94793.1 HTH-type transcriptional regulator MhqR [Corynebacterium felinum]
MKTTKDHIAEAKRNWQAHGWPDAAEGMATVVSVIRAAQLLSAEAERILSPFGISFSRYELLALLMFSRSGALPMTKASTRLQVPPASVTHMVSRLEKDGLVKRTPDPHDGRGTLVGITDQGIALVNAATPELNEFFENFGLDATNRDALFRLCSQVRHTYGDPVED